ncbi:MAG: hypothetical protein AAFX06_11355 [Planctomycetota bacterium]
MPLTLVLTFEALATAPLGCYGCSWNDTPAFDEAASKGVVWDRWTSPIDAPSGLIREWLSGSGGAVSRCNESGTTRLLTDDCRLNLAEVELGFDDLTRLDFTLPEQPAMQIEDTITSKVMAATLDLASDETSLLWLHSSVLRDVWDAPIERLEPDLDEEDAAPSFELPETASVPSMELDSKGDPDQLFAWMNRYAAQVRLIDSMIELLSLSLRHREPRFLIAGASGFSLGQNGFLGHRVGPLRSSDIRLPMLTSLGGPLRAVGIWSAAMFPEILTRVVNEQEPLTSMEWAGACGEFDPRVTTRSDRASVAVTSSKWFMVGNQDQEQLFLKPDDLDDANDVARLRPEITEELLRAEGTDDSTD